MVKAKKRIFKANGYCRTEFDEGYMSFTVEADCFEEAEKELLLYDWLNVPIFIEVLEDGTEVVIK